MAFWVIYDHIGKLMLANLLWSMIVMVPLSLGGAVFWGRDPGLWALVGAPALLIAVGVALPVATAGLAHMIKELIDTRDGAVRTMLAGMRQYGIRAMAIGLIYVAGVTALATSVWFYARAFEGAWAWMGYVLSGLALWCLLFAALMALMVFPTLVQKRGSVGETIRLTALIVAGNPLLILGVGVQVACLAILSVIAAPMLFLFLGAWSMVLASTAFELLARKYASAAMSANASLGAERTAKPFPDDAEDDYLNRGIRDFLFPWKG